MRVSVISWDPDNGDPDYIYVGRTLRAAKRLAVMDLLKGGDRIYEAELIAEAKDALARGQVDRAYRAFVRWVAPAEVTVQRVDVAE